MLTGRERVAMIVLVGGLAALLASLAVLVFTPVHTVRPECPREDSCSLNYQGGHWYLDGTAVSR